MSGYGSVSVLDARGGSFLRTVAVGEAKGPYVLNCIQGISAPEWMPEVVRRWLPLSPASSRSRYNGLGSVAVIDAGRL